MFPLEQYLEKGQICCPPMSEAYTVLDCVAVHCSRLLRGVCITSFISILTRDELVEMHNIQPISRDGTYNKRRTSPDVKVGTCDIFPEGEIHVLIDMKWWCWMICFRRRRGWISDCEEFSEEIYWSQKCNQVTPISHQLLSMFQCRLYLQFRTVVIHIAWVLTSQD